MLEKANNIKRSNTNSKNEIVCCLILSAHRGDTTWPGEEMALQSQWSVAGTGCKYTARDGLGVAPWIMEDFCSKGAP